MRRASCFVLLGGILLSDCAQAQSVAVTREATSADNKTLLGTPTVSPEQHPSFTVLIFNFRQVPISTLREAEETARDIFKRAGLQLVWKECPTGDEPCHKDRGPVLLLALMSGPLQNRFLDTVAGEANIHEGLAMVYYDFMPRVSEAPNSSDNARILGCIIAHELGHLLLGPQHSIAGIMKGHWDNEQTRIALMDQLTFILKEGKFMQHALRTGWQPAEPSRSALVSDR